jgi:AcrR family transcriptional regulator
MPKPAKRPIRPRHGAASTSRRDEIRAVAGRVFAENGFAHTTMRQVGDASGTGAGSLYHHFTSKDEILLELLEGFYRDILGDLQAIIDPELDPLANLTAMIELAVRYVLERREESQILLNDYPYVAGSPVFATVIASADESTRIWIGIVREALNAGQLRPDIDVNIAFSGLMGSIFSSLRFYNPRGKIGREVYVEKMTTQMVEGLRRHGA